MQLNGFYFEMIRVFPDERKVTIKDNRLFMINNSVNDVFLRKITLKAFSSFLKKHNICEIE